MERMCWWNKLLNCMNDRSLEHIQELVLDIIRVERNHSIPNTNRHENVVEHSFSVALLCWKIYDLVKPPLNLEKIFKYSLVHDFLERGQNRDVNTYAPKDERAAKKERETDELKKLLSEFSDFGDFPRILVDYEARLDEESLFVWSVDKMQQIILGQMDKWRPYVGYGVTYDQFLEKNEEFLRKCSPYVKEIYRKAFEDSCTTYFDNPNVASTH